MKKLTQTQFTAIQSLAENPLINQISIDMHSNSLLRITVISADDADFNLIDMLLEDVFPGKQYRDSLSVAIDGNHYSIDVCGETLINLMMKKTPTKVEWPFEQILRNEG